MEYPVFFVLSVNAENRKLPLLGNTTPQTLYYQKNIRYNIILSLELL